jgi:site-specific DNA recombinase
MIAAIYVRKSTEQNGVADEQKSVARQAEHARQYAERKGWAVADEYVYVDDGISGAEFANRPGYLRLLNALKPRPPFQVLVMSEESRLGREAIETAYALKQLVQAGVRVFFYMEDRERTLETPTDKIMMSLTAFADELEREKARQRTYDAMLRKARAGHVTGGSVFGYENEEILDATGKRSHVMRRILETEAAIVRRIFRMCADGYGLTTIAKTLNAEHARCPRSQQGRPKGWAPSSVREVLYRELYRGVIVWNKSRKRDQWGQHRQRARAEADWLRVAAPHLQVVPDALWDAVHERLAGERRRYLRLNNGKLLGRAPGHLATPKYLLSGMLTCAVCGSSLEGRTRSHGRHRVGFYGCAGHRKKGATVCTNDLDIPMADADAAVLATIEEVMLDPTVLEAIVTRTLAQLEVDAAGESSNREALEHDLAGVERELATLGNALAAGGDMATVLAAIRAREQRRV